MLIGMHGVAENAIVESLRDGFPEIIVVALLPDPSPEAYGAECAWGQQPPCGTTHRPRRWRLCFERRLEASSCSR